MDNRLANGRERLDAAIDVLREVCEPVNPPKLVRDYLRYFCGRDSGNPELVAKTEPRRRRFYSAVDDFVAAYSELETELEAAGYAPREAAGIQKEVQFYTDVCDQLQRAVGEAAA